MSWLTNDDLLILIGLIYAIDAYLFWPNFVRWFEGNEWIGNIDFAWRRYRAGRGQHR